MILIILCFIVFLITTIISNKKNCEMDEVISMIGVSLIVGILFSLLITLIMKLAIPSLLYEEVKICKIEEYKKYDNVTIIKSNINNIVFKSIEKKYKYKFLNYVLLPAEDTKYILYIPFKEEEKKNEEN